MTVTCKQLVTNQIEEIVRNISVTGGSFIDGGQLVDSSASPPEIKDAIKVYNVEILDRLEPKEQREILLTNWIYCRYYQNREKAPSSERIDQRHFPFKHMSKEGTQAFWRNRFWRYDTSVKDRERVILTRGYETRFVEPQQFVDDEFVFESHEEGHKTVFEEIKYLSMVFPKFEIGDVQKFAFGKYPLDDDGQGSLIRFYFHLNTERLTLSIPLLVTKITACFNERLIPFELKFFSKATDFARSDHFVLYLEQRHFCVAAMLLSHMYRIIEVFLNHDALPYFVREAIPGIGFAKSPAKEQLSFGVARARAIAKAILKKFEDPAIDPVLTYLERTWGGIEHFYLNPKPPFVYDFNLFQNGQKNAQTILFEDVSEDDALSAAWYIARLFCREAVWIEDGQCNWLSYQRTDKDRLCYRLLAVDNGAEGLEGVILFLQSFKAIGIRDAILEYTLAAAEKFFAGKNGKKMIVKAAGKVVKSPIQTPTTTMVLSQGFAGEQLRQEFEKAITKDEFPKFSELGLLNNIMTAHIQTERPVGNRLDGSDNFCADMRYGFAGYGYAYLRLYDAIRVPRLKIQLN